MGASCTPQTLCPVRMTAAVEGQQRASEERPQCSPGRAVSASCGSSLDMRSPRPLATPTESEYWKVEGGVASIRVFSKLSHDSYGCWTLKATAVKLGWQDRSILPLWGSEGSTNSNSMSIRRCMASTSPQVMGRRSLSKTDIWLETLNYIKEEYEGSFYKFIKKDHY